MSKRKTYLVFYKSNGFTLIELMVTIGIIGIFAVICVPSYKSVIASNRIEKEVFDLHGDLELARSYSQKTGLPIIVCPANAGATACLDNNDWSHGWLVAVATNGCDSRTVSATPLNVSNKFTNNDSAIFYPASNGDNWLCFNRVGVLSSKYNGMFVFDVSGGSGSHPYMRCLAAHITGQTSLVKFNQVDSVSGKTCK